MTKRRWDASGSQVQITDVRYSAYQGHGESLQGWWIRRFMNTATMDEDIYLVKPETKCLNMRGGGRETFSPRTSSCGRARASSGMWLEKQKGRESHHFHTRLVSTACSFRWKTSCGVSGPPTTEKVPKQNSLSWWSGANEAANLAVW